MGCLLRVGGPGRGEANRGNRRRHAAGLVIGASRDGMLTAIGPTLTDR